MPIDIKSLPRLGSTTPETISDPVAFDRVTPKPIGIATRLHELATRKLDDIAADLDDRSSDPQACERRARALATVALALDEITRTQTHHAAENWIVDEDDPRACPRDPEHLRTALAEALDRISESKTIYLI